MKTNKLFIIIILIFGIFLRIYFFVGPCCDDDVAYLNSAHNLLKLNFDELKNGIIFAYRTMMNVPIVIFFKLFGISEFTASLYIVLTSVGSVLIAYLIGMLLFDERTGIIAAFLLSFYPLEVIYSTHIVPDVPLAFFMGLTVLFLLYAGKKKNPNYYFISGICAGLGYLVKIMGITIFPFVLLYTIFFLKKGRIKAFSKFLTGFLVIFLIECAYSYYFTSHPFMSYKSHISATEAWGHMKEKSWEEIKSNLLFYPSVMFSFGSGITNLNFYTGFFFWLFVLAYLTPVFYKTKRKEFLIILLWFFSIFFFLQFGTMDITRFVITHKLIRFLTVLSIPLCVTIAYFFSSLLSKGSFLKFFTILVFLIFLMYDSIIKTDKITSYENNQILGDVKEIYKLLKSLPKKDVYFYQYTREFGLLEFYFEFDEEDRLKLLYNTPCESIKDAYVVTDDNVWYFSGGPEYPECLKNPPENWKLISIIDKADEGIYKIFDPKIYYAE